MMNFLVLAQVIPPVPVVTMMTTASQWAFLIQCIGYGLGIGFSVHCMIWITGKGWHGWLDR